MNPWSADAVQISKHPCATCGREILLKRKRYCGSVCKNKAEIARAKARRQGVAA